MKILYDLTPLVSPRTGIGYYTQHLIKGMLDQTEIEDIAGMQYRTIYTKSELHDLLNQASFVPPNSFVQLKKRIVPLLRFLPGSYKARFFLRRKLSQGTRAYLAKEGFIYHETNFIPQPYTGKLIISVHDISHIRYPEHHPKERVANLNYYLPRALKRADRIITGSEFAREELLTCFNVEPEKVVTVLNGVSAEFKPRNPQETKATLNKYSITYGQYMLSVCTLEPRKNLVRLLKAFSLLSEEIRQAYPLVLVGGKGWQEHEIQDLAAPLLQAKQLIFTGYVPEVDLPQIYAGAKIFAYPSLYEGFGLPVLEAMASGAPVLTSNNTSLVEVSAGAAVEIDPLSIEEIAQGLKRLVEDKKLANDCIAKGLMRARSLTWDNCVDGTIKVYQSIS